MEKDEWASLFGSSKADIEAMGKKMKGKDMTGNKMIRPHSDWGQYLVSLDDTSKLPPGSGYSEKLGCFAIALQNQMECIKLESSEIEKQKVDISPQKKHNTRASAKDQPDGLEFYQLNYKKQTEVFSRAGPISKQASPEQEVERPKLRALSDTSFSSSGISQLSSLTDSKAKRAKAVDEQIVNTAAITFLQCLFVHDGRQNYYWSSHRKRFCLQTNKTVFRAIIDGHLQINGEQRSAAILEVKARGRGDEFQCVKIEMQESAQMALWISDEPLSYWKGGENASMH